MNPWHRFQRNETGASAIEFAFMAPLLLVVLIGTVTVFDLFRNAQNVEKATFTVGDILSRQTEISQATLTSQLRLVRHTVPTAGDGGLRVTSISMVNDELVTDWSKTVGDADAIAGADIPYEIIPDIANGDSVLLTETFVPHRAFVAGFGLDAIVFKSRSVQRPRFVGSIVFVN